MNGLLLIFIFLVYSDIFAVKESFFVKKDGHVIKRQGFCNERYSPCSTFKIALSLIAYNENILTDENNPVLPYDIAYQAAREECRQECNPSKWIRHSVIWYSQIIMQKLGMNKVQNYMARFNYGNQNISGDKGKNNGLTQAWLSSSLQISVDEQVEFLQKFLSRQLSITAHAYEKTRAMLYLEPFSKSFELYGKTGSGNYRSLDGSLDEDRQFGWFIGWLEKNESKIIFALYIEDEKKEAISAGLRAKKIAKDKLLQVVECDFV